MVGEKLEAGKLVVEAYRVPGSGWRIFASSIFVFSQFVFPAKLNSGIYRPDSSSIPGWWEGLT